ncbi:MAG: hypothetical protein GX985_07795 [Gallicola sp.]|nr:hypothetical protein [Gallicola sp.]
MKKALIFSLSTGGGHNTAARNLKEIFTDSDYEVVIVDTMNKISPKLDRTINKGYETLANKVPSSWGALYQLSNKKKISKGLFSTLAKVSRKTIIEILHRERPDIILGTHPFVVSFIASMKKEGIIRLPFISVVTDFVAHDLYLHDYVDAYIVGSDFTKIKMVEKGIHPDRVHSCGIPISKIFTIRKDPPSFETFKILVMAGSVGFNYIIHIVDALLSIDRPIHIRALCGRNDKIKGKMKRRFAKDIQEGRLELFSYTDDVASLMDDSHCVLTKPGGLSVTEALNKNLPLLLPHYVPGQEKENVEFLLSNHLAFYARTPKETKKIMEEIMDSPEVLDTVKDNMEKITSNYHRKKIIHIANELIKKGSFT